MGLESWTQRNYCELRGAQGFVLRFASISREFMRDGDGRSSLQNLEPLHVLRTRYLQAKTQDLHPRAPNSRWRRCNEGQRSHASAHGRLETSRGHPQSFKRKAACVCAPRLLYLEPQTPTCRHRNSWPRLLAFKQTTYASSCKAVALETFLRFGDP